MTKHDERRKMTNDYDVKMMCCLSVKQVKTNEHGEFKIQLPFSVRKHVKRIKGCVVKLVSSNEPFCSIASAASSSSLHLKSMIQGNQICN
uniref:Uncharacterized protein n=1 Tax=Medicago truncatula TaxID=3880 RepID=A2Q629_MEDTR|nr:hypothetical protein MtrDRAFT_AC172742g21v1 [Medicago truncatula]